MTLDEAKARIDAMGRQIAELIAENEALRRRDLLGQLATLISDALKNHARERDVEKPVR